MSAQTPDQPIATSRTSRATTASPRNCDDIQGSEGGPAPTPRLALALLPAWWFVAAATSGAVSRLAPGSDGMTRALVATVALTSVAVALAVRLRHRPGHDPVSLGLTGPASCRRPGLIAFVLLLALVPLAGGIRWDGEVSALAVLAVGYLLTGFTEELVWRGTALQLLRPLGSGRAVLVGSTLFAAAHLTNILFRDNVALVGAQAFGAFCFGIGYAAVRLETGALPALMLTHLLTDLLPHVGRLPAIPVFVAQDVILLGLGLFLIRRRSGAPDGEAGL